MKEFTNKIHCGDNLELLKQLPDNSIDVVITSPPYWGLRDYSDAAEKIWGGDPDCEHDFSESHTRHQEAPGKTSLVKQKGLEYTVTTHTCSKCGAWKGQFGLEPHPQMYIDHSVEIYREVMRVLKSTGSFYLNIGDSYHSSPAGNKELKQSISKGTAKAQDEAQKKKIFRTDGKWLQSKQLLLIPSRVAAALQEDGWILRSDIIWAKPNPMPCSVQDRLNNTYEHVFHFVKNQDYYYDLDEIRVPPSTGFDYVRKASAQKGNEGAMSRQGEDDIANNPLGKNPGDFFDIFNDDEYKENMRKARIHMQKITELSRKKERKGYDKKYSEESANNTDGKSVLENVAMIRRTTDEYIKDNGIEGKVAHILKRFAHEYAGNPLGKNPGDFYVGTDYNNYLPVTVKPFADAHFAVFPPELLHVPLKSSCPKQICIHCGKPRERITENIDILTDEQKEELSKQRARQREYIEETRDGKKNAKGSRGCIPSSDLIPVAHETVGWTTCDCAEPKYTPGIVLDPFNGSGTSCLVAKGLGFRYIGFDINPEYCKMAESRIEKAVAVDIWSSNKVDINDVEPKKATFDQKNVMRKKSDVGLHEGEAGLSVFLGEEEKKEEPKNPLDDRPNVKMISKEDEKEKEEDDVDWTF